jgi:methylglutamate dehydrogenase subunit D
MPSVSALAQVYVPGRYGAIDGGAAVAITERVDRTIVQVSGWPESIGALCRTLENLFSGAMPADGKTAAATSRWTIFRVAPERFWIAGSAGDSTLAELASTLGGEAIVTQIDHSRVVLRVAGRSAAVVLNRGIPVDLDEGPFARGAFAQSVVHGIPVLVHRVADVDGNAAFDVYVSRDYAVSFWEWLTGVAQTLGYEVGPLR